jgi:hypothetical protein
MGSCFEEDIRTPGTSSLFLISGDTDGNSFFYQMGKEKKIELCCKNACITKGDLKIQSNSIKIPMTTTGRKKKGILIFI